MSGCVEASEMSVCVVDEWEGVWMCGCVGVWVGVARIVML